MSDSGPTLLGQLATCVPIEVCVLHFSTHAEILRHPDMLQKYSTESWTIQQLICLRPSLERAEAWQIIGQDASAFCGCASDWVLIETRRGVRNVWFWAHLVISLCWDSLLHAYLLIFVHFNLVLMQRFFVWRGTKIFNKISNDSPTDLPLA